MKTCKTEYRLWLPWPRGAQGVGLGSKLRWQIPKPAQCSQLINLQGLYKALGTWARRTGRQTNSKQVGQAGLAFRLQGCDIKSAVWVYALNICIKYLPQGFVIAWISFSMLCLLYSE